MTQANSEKPTLSAAEFRTFMADITPLEVTDDEFEEVRSIAEAILQMERGEFSPPKVPPKPVN
jgi:hypothetical protein